MTTIILTAVDICPGGEHIDINIQFNGVDKGNRQVTVTEVLADFDEYDINGFIKSTIRAYKVGKTNAQVKAGLLAGITVTI